MTVSTTFDHMLSAQELRGVIAFSGAILLSRDPAITAHAGGGQGSAYQLEKLYSVITTCATSGDSVKLPAALDSSYSRIAIVTNTTGANCSVYPQSGGTISGNPTNTSISLTTGVTMVFFASTDIDWYLVS